MKMNAWECVSRARRRGRTAGGPRRVAYPDKTPRSVSNYVPIYSECTQSYIPAKYTKYWSADSRACRRRGTAGGGSTTARNHSARSAHKRVSIKHGPAGAVGAPGTADCRGALSRYTRNVHQYIPVKYIKHSSRREPRARQGRRRPASGAPRRTPAKAAPRAGRAKRCASHRIPIKHYHVPIKYGHTPTKYNFLYPKKKKKSSARQRRHTKTYVFEP